MQYFAMCTACGLRLFCFCFVLKNFQLRCHKATSWKILSTNPQDLGSIRESLMLNVESSKRKMELKEETCIPGCRIKCRVVSLCSGLQVAPQAQHIHVSMMLVNCNPDVGHKMMKVTQ